jgi:hypothetical protein
LTNPATDCAKFIITTKKRKIIMDARESKKFRIFLYVTAALIIVCAAVDAVFFKMIDETGLIGLGVCIFAMLASSTKKSKKIKLNPKTEKIIMNSLLVLIVSGIFTALIAI